MSLKVLGVVISGLKLMDDLINRNVLGLQSRINKKPETYQQEQK
jgi:hypothetical protein